MWHSQQLPRRTVVYMFVPTAHVICIFVHLIPTKAYRCISFCIYNAHHLHVYTWYLPRLAEACVEISWLKTPVTPLKDARLRAPVSATYRQVLHPCNICTGTTIESINTNDMPRRFQSVQEGALWRASTTLLSAAGSVCFARTVSHSSDKEGRAESLRSQRAEWKAVSSQLDSLFVFRPDSKR